MATLEVIEGLKVKASTAQSLFTKRANKIENNLNSLREDKLVAELEELEACFETYEEAVTDYLEALDEEDDNYKDIVDSVKDKIGERRHKYEDIRQRSQETLWGKFIEPKLGELQADWDAKLKHAENEEGQEMSQKAYNSVRAGAATAIELMSEFVTKWGPFIPESHENELKKYLRKSTERSRKTLAVLKSQMGDSESSLSSEQDNDERRTELAEMEKQGKDGDPSRDQAKTPVSSRGPGEMGGAYGYSPSMPGIMGTLFPNPMWKGPFSTSMPTLSPLMPRVSTGITSATTSTDTKPSTIEMASNELSLVTSSLSFPPRTQLSFPPSTQMQWTSASTTLHSPPILTPQYSSAGMLPSLLPSRRSALELGAIKKEDRSRGAQIGSSGGQTRPTSSMAQAGVPVQAAGVMAAPGFMMPRIALAPMTLPTFSGDKRGYYQWRDKWARMQQMAEPTGSPELMLFHLLDSISDTVKKELRLDYCRDVNDVFRALQSCYGNVPQIVKEITTELQEFPAVRGNQPKETLQLIQAVEMAVHDLTDLQSVHVLQNQLVVDALERKLPMDLMRQWLAVKLNPLNGINDFNLFDGLLHFLRGQKEILMQQDLLLSKRPVAAKKGEQSQSRSKQRERGGENAPEKRASTKATVSGEKDSSTQGPCAVCDEDGHAGKLFRCKTFRKMVATEKRAQAKKLKVCFKCLEAHEGSCRRKFLCRNIDCKKGDDPPDHHFLLCLKSQPAKDIAPKERKKGGGAKGGEKEDQDRESRSPAAQLESVSDEISLLKKEIAELKLAKTHKISTTVCVGKRGPKVHPVLLMLMDVEAKRGGWVGALIDLASDTNYITHQAAKKLGLCGEPVTLVVRGVAGMETTVETKKYTVELKVAEKKRAFHKMDCYGLDEIARIDYTVDAKRLEKLFPRAGSLKRPKKVELLISAKEGRLAPRHLRRRGDLVLWDSPLGKTVTGVHADLTEGLEMTAHVASSHCALTMRAEAVRVEIPMSYPEQSGGEVSTVAVCNADVLKWMRWDSIGAACDPICGGCRCGKCPPGGKEMTLADERELAVIKEGLTYRLSDAHSDKPHWDASYPWKEDPSTLPNNRNAVKATFLKSEKRLSRNPEWKDTYAEQVHDMVQRGAAVKLSKTAMEEWKGPVWYINHLMAPNPHSSSTPVRIVWDSSQEFQGVSMNSILLKGPDVLNPIRAVLLRFREGEHAAIGDISKMYNSVWLEEREMHLHRFLWRDSPDEDIMDYAVVRVNMGDRPAGCISQVAMRETANLPQFSDMVDEKDVIENNAYVDDLFCSHNNAQRLNDILTGVETILATGGFHLKPWVRSGQSGRQSGSASKRETVLLPNQMRDEDNKALGVGYHVTEDSFFLMVAINFSARKRKMRTGLNLTVEEVEEKTPNPLTRRELLSQVAGLYDPLGLATPLKQKGVILVRRAFQEAGTLTRDTWDKPLSDELRGRAIEMFKEYAQLSSITFPRSITPPGWVGKPWGITFSDGSSESYGAVLYLRWETSSGVEVRLVESKAKLTPLDQKGDAVKAEICGAVFASRLKGHMLKHSRLEVDKWFHFVDSQTVLGAIQRDSYGFQTFFANRVGEIQKSGPASDWWWIPGEENVADLVTRGCTLEQLQPDSPWQKGPKFLSAPVEAWPMRSAAEVAARSREAVGALRRKAFSAVTTRAQARKQNVSSNGDSKPPVIDSSGTPTVDDGEATSISDVISTPATEKGPSVTAENGVEKMWGSLLTNLFDSARFSSLSKLCGAVGYARRFLQNLTSRETRQKVLHVPLLVRERKAAFRELCLASQTGVSFPTTTLNRLVVSKDAKSGLLLCQGRVQAVDDEKTGVPLIPYGERIGELLAEDAHAANHEGVAGTLLRMRKKAWVVQGSRVARKIIDACLHCRKRRAQLCSQVMSDLPVERTTPAAPFQYTTLDLFGPYTVRDMIKRRSKMKVWGVVYSCMASRAIHADLVEDLSTEGFLKTYLRFTALRGHPRKLWSDPGTNFVGAKPALEALYKFLAALDKDDIQRTAAVNGTDWEWVISPADSPHRNGAAEAAVRVLKRAMSSIGAEENLSVLEFQTLLYLAANLTNERPIGAKAQAQEESVEIITPNSLLLGRAKPEGDTLDFDFPSYPFSRLRAVQIEVDKFWKRWSQLAGPHLFIREKWHVPGRNVAVGDLVWVADQNALRGRFRLGRVAEAVPDNQGIVRDVVVKTCPSHPISWSQVRRAGGSVPSTSTLLRRDVRRLVVLVPVEDQV